MGTAIEATENPLVEGQWTATGHEAPVFYDHRGRRRHLVSGAGVLLATAAIGWMGGLVGGSVGFAALRAPVSGRVLFASPAAHGSHRYVAGNDRTTSLPARDIDRKL